jgi:SAM-dependent methyltransferase
MLFKPHYVRDYRRMVRNFLKIHSLDDAMARSVGGDYEAVGARQVELLRSHGLRDADYLIDIGCGSGRTAYALRGVSTLRYFGIDVVPELIAYAERKAARPDWRFAVVEGLSVPEDTAQADFIVMFSVLTHLTAEEGRTYVADALRVLKPGGRLLGSFLDETIEAHRRAAGGWLEQLRNRLRAEAVLGVTLARAQIEEWAHGFGVEAELHGPEAIGQSYFVFTKPK